METIRILTSINLTVEVRDSDGQLVNATSLVFYVRDPTGKVTEYKNTDAEYSNPTTGRYILNLTPDIVGVWAINAQATNPTVSSTVKISVSDRY